MHRLPGESQIKRFMKNAKTPYYGSTGVHDG